MAPLGRTHTTCFHHVFLSEQIKMMMMMMMTSYHLAVFLTMSALQSI